MLVATLLIISPFHKCTNPWSGLGHTDGRAGTQEAAEMAMIVRWEISEVHLLEHKRSAHCARQIWIEIHEPATTGEQHREDWHLLNNERLNVVVYWLVEKVFAVASKPLT